MRRLASRWRVWLAAGVLLALAWLGLTYIDHSLAARYGPQVEFDTARWALVDLNSSRNDTPTARQRMLRDLVVRVLPGKDRAEIERLLGRSQTPAEARRYSAADSEFREKDEQGNWKPFPRTGKGYYHDEYDWDLKYYIGKEQISTTFWPLTPDPRMEAFLIRLDAAGVFASWYVTGPGRWPTVVGQEGTASYRATR